MRLLHAVRSRRLAERLARRTLARPRRGVSSRGSGEEGREPGMTVRIGSTAPGVGRESVAGPSREKWPLKPGFLRCDSQVAVLPGWCGERLRQRALR